MAFALLPAVDVADGRAARIAQAPAGSETHHGEPLDVALAWQAAGAEWIHLVDLDAAYGRGSNAELLASVVAEVDVKVELAGGIVDDASLDQALATGCERVIIGAAAVGSPSWCGRVASDHGERVAVGLDVRITQEHEGAPEHRLTARGSTVDLGDLWETLAQLDRYGCGRYVVTDVDRDGMLLGPDLDLYRAVTSATDRPVIASGGVSSLDDLVALAHAAAERPGLEGAIVGKALLADHFSLSAALKAVQQL